MRGQARRIVRKEEEGRRGFKKENRGTKKGEMRKEKGKKRKIQRRLKRKEL